MNNLMFKLLRIILVKLPLNKLHLLSQLKPLKLKLIRKKPLKKEIEYLSHPLLRKRQRVRD